MNIEAKTNFKHGKMDFQDGMSYTVPDRLGQYFKNNGWATDAQSGVKCFNIPLHFLAADEKDLERLVSEAEGRAGAASLDIHDVNMTLNSEVK